MNGARKIFLVVAGGNADAERHFHDTIRNKRTFKEVEKYLPAEELWNLRDIYHGSDFIAWGATPGPQNQKTWEKMEPGDAVLIYNSGCIKFAGEVAAKARNKDLAKFFWKENQKGDTWELVYFIVNEQEVNVPIEKLNPYLNYKSNFKPQGFMLVNETATQSLLQKYGDIYGILKTLSKGEDIFPAPSYRTDILENIEEGVTRAPTEHDEMQWRLIRLGQLSKCDVWIPKNDQGKQYEGNKFRENVLPEFQEGIDIPPTIRNIDVVWKFGPHSIKSAFEIEHSTSVYSGILRLSDLRAQTPNSSYPLFIVASEERRKKVFDELRRPTFSGPCLRLNEVIRFIGYKKIREIDESFKGSNFFDSNTLLNAGEPVPM